jgi:hypothetical protein
MPGSPDIPALAAKLTKAERQAISDEFLSLRSSVARVRKQLFIKDLIYVGGVATPLGLAVRQHLLTEGSK